MQPRFFSRFGAPAVLAAALLLASCGGQADTELATIDDGVDVVEQPGGDDGRASVEASINTVPALVDGGDASAPAPVPDAPVPPAPGPASSPAQRQQQQELGLVEDGSDTADLEAGASPDGADLDADGAGSEAAAAPRSDLEQFPSEIPAVVPGAPSAPSASSANPGFGAGSFFGGSDTPIDVGDGDTSADTGGPVVASTGSTTAAELTVEAADIVDVDPCEAAGGCDDPASAAGDGGGGVVAADPASAGDASDAGGVNDSTESDCDRRPYDRGCPLPDAGGDAFSADDGETEDALTDAIQDDGEGVDVPDAVLEALLAPADNDNDGNEGGGAGGDDTGGEADEPGASASDGEPTETSDGTEAPALTD